VSTYGWRLDLQPEIEPELVRYLGQFSLTMHMNCQLPRYCLAIYSRLLLVALTLFIKAVTSHDERHCASTSHNQAIGQRAPYTGAAGSGELSQPVGRQWHCYGGH